MSRIIANTQINERYPSVINNLVYTYPLDGNIHCCVTSLKYIKVLSIKNGSSELYNLFQKENSIIINSPIDILNEDLIVNEGEYNIIAIDSAGSVLDEAILSKLYKVASKAKVSIYIHSQNDPKSMYVAGGSCLYIDSYINKDKIIDILTRSTVCNAKVNTVELQDELRVVNGNITLPFDVRIDSFSLAIDIFLEQQVGIVGLINLVNDNTSILSILYDTVNKDIIAKEGLEDVTVDNVSTAGLDSYSKLLIVKHGETLFIFIDETLKATAQFSRSLKGNKLTIGKNNISNIENSAFIRVKNIALYDKVLSKEDVRVLNKGRFIFT